MSRRARCANDFAAALCAVGILVTLYDERQYRHAQINKNIGPDTGITRAIEAFVDGV